MWRTRFIVIIRISKFKIENRRRLVSTVDIRHHIRSSHSTSSPFILSRLLATPVSTTSTIECFRFFPGPSRNRLEWLVPPENDDAHFKSLIADGATSRPATTLVLMEVVGAMGLSTQAKTCIDPYCIVKVRSKLVHRTKEIRNDGNPIWTVKTQSLCLLEIPGETSDSTSSTIEGKQNKSVVEESIPGAGDTVTIEIFHDGGVGGLQHQRLGTVSIFFDELVAGTGERNEYTVQPAEDAKFRTALLALRFRRAVREDLVFLGKIGPDEATSRDRPAVVGSDIDFQNVNRRSIFQSTRKVQHKQEYFRVMPYPDPSRPKETEWMTRREIHQEALKPSVRWVTAGYGTVGTVFLEIVGCNDLPNLDFAAGDLTDPFVGIAFEDTMVRTDIIWNELNPRWMPWTTRAFAFNVQHPTSLIMLGIFDYDDTLLDHHDPAGRVVINTANFECDTSYLLHYKLHHDPRQEDSRGTIIIRLRIEWKNESKAMRLALTAPPRFIINTETDKAYNVLRYLTRGAVDMETSSLDSVKLYSKELASYTKNYCFVLDVMVEIFLWRGRLKITKTRSIWFPLHSMALLFAVVLAFERPQFILPMFLYAIAWVMLSLNFHASRHPYPWKRVKASEKTNMVVLLGRSIHPPIVIEPGQGVAGGQTLHKLDKLKAERISKLMQELVAFGLKVSEIYSKTSESSVKMATERRDWSLLAERLYYVHTALKTLCGCIRMFRSLVNWKGYYAHHLTMHCILIATIWITFSVNKVMTWVLRLLIWTLLGPHMKLLDMYWVHSFYKTRDELLQDIADGVEATEPSVPDFDAWLASEMFIKMAHSGRIVGEDQYKLKDMRERLYGKYSEVIPRFDTSRFPSVPLPESSARAKKRKPNVKEHWYHVPSQRLQGHMILQPIREEIIPDVASQGTNGNDGDDFDDNGIFTE